MSDYGGGKNRFEESQDSVKMLSGVLLVIILAVIVFGVLLWRFWG